MQSQLTGFYLNMYLKKLTEQFIFNLSQRRKNIGFLCIQRLSRFWHLIS